MAANDTCHGKVLFVNEVTTTKYRVRLLLGSRDVPLVYHKAFLITVEPRFFETPRETIIGSPTRDILEIEGKNVEFD